MKTSTQTGAKKKQICCHKLQAINIDEVKIDHTVTKMLD